MLADYLDYQPSVVQAIYHKGKESGSVHCCKEFFTDWYHSDNGVKPCSWETLVGALRHARFGHLYSHIKKGLVKSMYDYMNNNVLLLISLFVLYSDPTEIYLLVHGQYLILSKVYNISSRNNRLNVKFGTRK